MTHASDDASFGRVRPARPAFRTTLGTAHRRPVDERDEPMEGSIRVAVFVSDWARSAHWYIENLHLHLVKKVGHWVIVAGSGSPWLIHLCQVSELGLSAPLASGPTGIELPLPGDFLDECAALQENGVRFTKWPTRDPWGWWAVILDPDGNEITLVPLGSGA